MPGLGLKRKKGSRLKGRFFVLRVRNQQRPASPRLEIFKFKMDLQEPRVLNVREMLSHEDVVREEPQFGPDAEGSCIGNGEDLTFAVTLPQYHARPLVPALLLTR